MTSGDSSTNQPERHRGAQGGALSRLLAEAGPPRLPASGDSRSEPARRDRLAEPGRLQAGLCAPLRRSSCNQTGHLRESSPAVDERCRGDGRLPAAGLARGRIREGRPGHRGCRAAPEVHPALRGTACSRGCRERQISQARAEALLRQGTRDAVRAPGIEKHVTAHTLRHTAATWLRQELGDTRLVAEYLGHADLSTVSRYAHVEREELFEAAGRLERLAVPEEPAEPEQSAAAGDDSGSLPSESTQPRRRRRRRRRRR
jgi:hypothetical protein